LYAEFWDNRENYKHVADLYRGYYLTGKRWQKDREVVGKIEPDSYFCRLTKGFKKRRKLGEKRFQKKQQDEEAKMVGKKQAELRLKDYALNAAGYMEDFKAMREIMRYSLKRITLRIKAELNRYARTQEELEERLNNGEIIEDKVIDEMMPRVLTLSKQEINQLRVYESLFKRMRASLKLPERYNVNLEDTEDLKSLSDLAKQVQVFANAGGELKDQDGVKVPIINVTFDREDV